MKYRLMLTGVIISSMLASTSLFLVKIILIQIKNSPANLVTLHGLILFLTLIIFSLKKLMLGKG